jgi:zinc transporter
VQSTGDSAAVPLQALIYGFRIDAEGTVSEIDADSLSTLDPNQAGCFCWVHLNRLAPGTQTWLQQTGAMDDIVLGALLQEDTRPRIVRHNDGFLLNLRGVNLNPGASPEDMISLRMWATRTCVITTRAKRILAAEDLRDQFRAGTPPRNSGALIVFLARQLVGRMGPVIAELDDRVDDIEEQLLTLSASSSRSSISDFRRMVLSLRRYMAPQREALSSFLREGDDFLHVGDKISLREIQDSLVRLLEDLDMIRERALLLQEQLVELRAQAMNDRLFVLSVISVIFLPLGFITGLFGVNVGGMPGVESPVAFALLSLGMLVFALLVVWVFRRLKWI